LLESVGKVEFKGSKMRKKEEREERDVW